MRGAMLALLLAVSTPVLAKPEVVDPAVAARQARRARLAAHLGKAFALLLGQPLTDVIHPRQEGHFQYLAGVGDHGASLLLAGAEAEPLTVPDGPRKQKIREVVYLRSLGPRYAQFYGLQYEPGEVTAKKLGIEFALRAPLRPADLARLVVDVLPKDAQLHIPEYRGRDHAFVREIRKVVVDAIRAGRKDVKVVDLHPHLARMRSVKDAYEVEQITKAIAVTHEAFRSALSAIRPDSTEAAVHGALLSVVRRRNAWPAYPFVVGAGNNATLPHYFRNDQPMRAGDLVVIDAGAAVRRYASDVTRTFPVSGRFTPRQREVYEVVLQAQGAAIAAVRPGATMGQVHQVAKKVLHAAGLAKYFIHGTSHHVGLDVHDPGPAKLEAGMTITVEPGVYILAERIGVRIEDIVLVTETGARVLGEPFPKTVEEIEALLAGRG